MRVLRVREFKKLRGRDLAQVFSRLAEGRARSKEKVMQAKKVTVIGAGNVGATCAHLILSKGLADVVLIDAAEGIAKGKALDLMQAQPIERFPTRITGTSYKESADSDIVVITAGLARKPGMSREELAGKNVAIVTEVSEQALRYSPNAVFIIVYIS